MPSSQPLISVIVPTRNYAHFLPDALDSVVSQTYRPIEVVVVDDGSTDNTQDLLHSFEFKDKTKRFILLGGEGLPSARNAGLDAASGDWIMFLDADDLLARSAAELLYQTARDVNADMAIGDWQGFWRTDKLYEGPRVSCRRPFKSSTFGNVIFHRPVASAFIAKRSQCRFDPSLHISELYDYLLSYGLEKPKVSSVDQVVTHTREHNDPNRLTVGNRHFDPTHRLEIVKRWRPHYITPGACRESKMAIEFATLTLALQKYHETGEIDPVVDELCLNGLTCLGLSQTRHAAYRLLGVRRGIAAGRNLRPLVDALRRRMPAGRGIL